MTFQDQENLMTLSQGGAIRGSQTMKIMTEYWMKPGPERCWDWSAVTEEYDGPGSRVGYGPTETDAVADLRQRHEDDGEPLPDDVEIVRQA